MVQIGSLYEETLLYILSNLRESELTYIDNVSRKEGVMCYYSQHCRMISAIERRERTSITFPYSEDGGLWCFNFHSACFDQLCADYS